MQESEIDGDGLMRFPCLEECHNCRTPAYGVALAPLWRVRKARSVVNQNHTEPAPPIHQVIADGTVIYEGEDWQQAFLQVGRNPEFGEIIHVCDGTPGAQWGPPMHWRSVERSLGKQ